MVDSRASIPAAVARQLRQEAGFGCCVCGHPIFQYHHIVPYASDPHYRPEDMMVLCPTHHDRATKRAFPDPEQRRYKAQPFNIKHRRARGALEVTQRYCAFQAGTVEMFGKNALIQVDDRTLLSLQICQEGYLALTLVIDGQDGSRVAEIVDNEWTAGDPLPWDLQAGWQRVRLLRRDRSTSLEVDAREEPVRIRARLWHSGQLVELGSDIRLSGKACVGFEHLCLVGLVLRIRTKSSRLEMVPDARVGHAYLVSQPTKELRLNEARRLWNKMDNPTISKND